MDNIEEKVKFEINKKMESIKELLEITDSNVINDNEERINGGCNLIYYGVPGTGKSYAIDKMLQEIDKSCIYRVTFHPEFTYNYYQL